MAHDWLELTRRSSFASHRLIGWIYWDPRAIELYTQLGIPNGTGYYVASRAAPLLPAGHQAVAAAFYSIHPKFIEFAVTLSAQHANWQDVYFARNQAAGEGLRQYVPEICNELESMRDELWQVADSLPESGRVCFAAHRQAPRVDDALVSSWLAVNCIREWRGDTHFAILTSEDISRVQAGILHDAHLNYGGWIAQSRGADAEAITQAFADLESRGLAEDGVVSTAGLAVREMIEERTNELTQRAWQSFGFDNSDRFLNMVEPIGERLMKRIDDTAGPNWMPAARERRP